MEHTPESGPTTESIEPARDTQEALLRSAERYRQLFESQPIAMAVWDRATLQILAVNAAAVRQYGYTRNEFSGLTCDSRS